MLRKIDETLNIALYPFKNLNFFQRDLIIDVNKAKNEKKIKIINELYKQVRNSLIHQYSIRNADEVELMIKKYYDFLFEDEKSESEKYHSETAVYRHYFKILSDFSKSLISHRDGKIVYKHWKNHIDDKFLGPYSELEKVHVFYNLNKVISIDILASIYFVNNELNDMDQLENFYSMVNLADMQLDDVLVKGVAENHIHANASFNFNMSWEVIVNEKLKEEKYNMLFNGFVNKDFEEEPIVYFKMATILRILLAAFIYDFERIKKDITFGNWIQNKFQGEKILEEFFENLAENRKLSKYGKGYMDDVLDSLKKVLGIDCGDRKDDLIFHIFTQLDHIKTYGENIFLIKALKYMKNRIIDNNYETKEDILFCEYFFQYIRIKNETYQQLVQGDNIKGLTFFQEYFKRSTSTVKNVQRDEKEYYKLMLRTLFQNEYLKRVELRFSIPENEDEFRRSLKNLLKAYLEVLEGDYYVNEDKDKDFPRVGVVFHLIKERDKEPIDKCWYLFNEEKEGTHKKISFKGLQNKYMNQINLLTKLRNEEPYLSHFLLGIDAASLENNTPVQVFAPVYDMARDSKNDPISLKDKNGRLIKNKSLAFTFHAGEDFRHLISGLRRIDEVIEYCKFHSGDRIGHATALGVNVEHWASQNPVVILPRGEYLDNLLWMWGIYTGIQNVNPRINIILEQEIYKISKDIFKNNTGINAPMLQEVYQERFKEFTLNENYRVSIDGREDEDKYRYPLFCINAEDNQRIIWDADKLLHAYNCRCYKKKMEEPIYVKVSDIDVEIMKEIQNWIMIQLANKGIVVEVNPTSNAIIGEIRNMFDNHAFVINKVGQKENSNVMFNINSDDPMVFNTNISNEYAYLYYGLLYRGVCKEAALEWIEKRRVCGMETSFINNKLSNREYYEYLKGALGELGID
ncbi:hypothetical protein [Oceanirhabdus sp. W0125-5]|uniref:hypothetical protein n=1 Tax=Oceanirhabdus sp. W0125-5 TaxID=2999116 RepID=UPI0022F322AA|nr:hypothetical protein [Oceanirhabdus sp. W0125-5]WBW96310.1 hypothetical protein OW730_21840 [Oceanirhabdus sp. W0125-5]